jgi:hypothetical protein
MQIKTGIVTDSVLVHVPLDWNLNFLDNFLYPILINYSVLIYNSILAIHMISVR